MRSLKSTVGSAVPGTEKKLQVPLVRTTTSAPPCSERQPKSLYLMSIMTKIEFVQKHLLEECANNPTRDNRGRDFFVEEYQAASKIVAVVRADGNGHTACARVPGAYFDIDRGILFSSGSVSFHTQTLGARWAYCASSLDNGGAWSSGAYCSKAEHGQGRNNAGAGELEHVECFLKTTGV